MLHLEVVLHCRLLNCVRRKSILFGIGKGTVGCLVSSLMDVGGRGNTVVGLECFEHVWWMDFGFGLLV